MPFVPMPGAMPRGYSFRRNSERTLSQKSTDQASQQEQQQQQQQNEQLEEPVEMDSVVDLPSESEPYDTPYRDDFKGVTETKAKSKQYKAPKTSINKHETVYEGSSDEDDSESVSVVEASYVADTPIPTKSAISSQESYVSDQPTIALFGASGVTGGHFLTAALDAGYCVRCIVADDPREMGQHSEWDAVRIGLQDVEQIKAAVYQVDYVVIMLNDVLPGKSEYPAGFMTSFIERLYTILREEPSVQLVLFQATSLAIDVKGRIPIMSKVIKSVAQRRNTFLQDQDSAIHRIGMEHGLRTYNDENRSVNLAPPHFRFIVTRPSVLLQDGPSSKKLAASKSQPGPFPVTHIDLADFSLSALTMERMYDSSPYVVADSF